MIWTKAWAHKIKRKGDSRSPWRIPLDGVMWPWASPFKRTVYVTERTQNIIQVIQRLSKPILWNNSSKKTHSTRSYALDISVFIVKKSLNFGFVCKPCNISWAINRLSDFNLPATNAPLMRSNEVTLSLTFYKEYSIQSCKRRSTNLWVSYPLSYLDLVSLVASTIVWNSSPQEMILIQNIPELLSSHVSQ